MEEVGDGVDHGLDQGDEAADQHIAGQQPGHGEGNGKVHKGKGDGLVHDGVLRLEYYLNDNDYQYFIQRFFAIEFIGHSYQTIGLCGQSGVYSRPLLGID
jgi:hypothetical protein